MKTLGIISEFNPFHNGHDYLLRKSREVTGADLAISLMSGDFVQRGEPAIIDKWARADAAIKAGFDMVVEMPVHISLQSAEYFASGSVKILDKLGVDFLCFGIENIEADEFLSKVDILIQKENELDLLTQKYMENSSFTKARYDATVELLGDKDFITSNNILALEYIRAINKIGSQIMAIPIKRIASFNKDNDLREGQISSSTAIRKNLKDEDYKYHMPNFSYENMQEFISYYGTPSMYKIYDYFKFLLILERRPMYGIVGYEEGLENYLLKLALEENDFDNFIERATTKRYTSSRIRRLMINYILENRPAFNMYNINFYKVIAFNEKSQHIFKTSTMTPVITKSDEKNLSFTDQMILFQMIDASNLYSLLIGRDFNLDYTKKIGRY